jgi:predicted nucleic acid-binding protein
LLNSPLFIDTAYIYAITNPNDQWHKKAVEWQQTIVERNLRLVTTHFILTEVADGLSPLKFRKQAVEIIKVLENQVFIEMIPASSELFHQGLNVYENRTTKIGV